MLYTHPDYYSALLARVDGHDLYANSEYADREHDGRGLYVIVADRRRHVDNVGSLYWLTTADAVPTITITYNGKTQS